MWLEFHFLCNQFTNNYVHKLSHTYAQTHAAGVSPAHIAVYTHTHAAGINPAHIAVYTHTHAAGVSLAHIAVYTHTHSRS